MKALEKARDRRYETADGLARDIRRYLDGDPVEAGPPSATYRMMKFARKHRAALATGAAFLLLLLVATGVSIGLAFWASKEKARAESREQFAIEAVKRFRDVIADEPELKNTPALDALRKRLLKEPLTFFRALRDRLQADRDTRPESMARLARASFDLGLLTSEIGDEQDALIAYREALAIFQKLVNADPAVTRFQSELGTVHNNIGVLLRDTGKPGEALKSHESALAIRRRLADANPSVTQFQRDLAVSCENIGKVLDQIG